MRTCPTSSTQSCITITPGRSNHSSVLPNGKLEKSKRHSQADFEAVVSALKITFLILAGLAVSVFAQAPSDQRGQLPSQAKTVEGVVVPVPKEIFHSLDEFRDANWRAVQRPEIVHWKSHGDQAQIAILLGVEIAEGFIAMEAQDSTEVKNLGNTVLKLARGLGVEKGALRRSRSIMENADKNEWTAARNEWDGVFSDLQSGMIEIKSKELAQLVSLGGWLRGTEGLSALVLQNYSPQRAELIRQPVLLDYLEKELLGLSSKVKKRPIVVKMVEGIRRIRVLIQSENGPPTEKTVREIDGICEELVRLSSRHPA
jgi:hypothetical protein